MEKEWVYETPDAVVTPEHLTGMFLCPSSLSVSETLHNFVSEDVQEN
jgi:hypothetical protein